MTPRAGWRRRLRVLCAVALAAAGIGGCAQTTNPAPSFRYDGRYAGTRTSNLPEACGVPAAKGRTSAVVARGLLRLPLFGPATPLEGSVGDDGTLRASGLWRTPRGFNNMTVLRGRIDDGLLTGTATDLRCVTELRLRRVR